MFLTPLEKFRLIGNYNINEFSEYLGAFPQKTSICQNFYILCLFLQEIFSSLTLFRTGFLQDFSHFLNHHLFS